MLVGMDNFFINHFDIIASMLLIVGGYFRLQWEGKLNGTKLDTVISETKNMANSQHSIQLDVKSQGVQLSRVAQDVTEIKHETRSHDKEISNLNARMAAAENQLKAS